MRDYALGETFDIKFTTRRFTTGVPFTLAGSPAVSIFVDNNTTPIAAGITLSVDFASTTGLNNVRVVATSGNGYASGGNYSLVITAGTIDSVSVVGEVVGEFSLEAQSPLRPTVADRTLDVTAAGNAGIDWANVENPTTALNLSGTNIDTDQVVASVTGAVGSVTGAVGSVTGAVGSVTGNVGGNVVGSVGSVVGAVGSVTGAVGSVTGNVGGNVVGSVGSVVGNVGGSVASVVGNVGGDVLGNVAGDVQGNVDGSVNNVIDGVSVGAGGITAASFAAGAIDSAALAASAGQEIADEILNRNLAGGGSGNTRNVRNALRSLRNRVGIVLGTVTIYEEDDTTPAWTGAVTTAAGNPISQIEPS